MSHCDFYFLFVSLQYIALHCIALHCIALQWYYKTFECNMLHPNGDPNCPANAVDHPYAMENVRNAICPHSYLGTDKEGK